MDGLYFDQGYSRSGRKDGQTPLIGGIIFGCRYKNMHPKLKNITIENCTVSDYYGDGISAFNIYVTNITITNNTLISAYITGDWTTAGVKGEQAINVHSGENIVITNNTIKGALDDAIAVHNNIRNLTITGNNITTTGGRILISGVDSGYIGNNSITYIQDGGTAIEASYSAGTKSFTFNNNIVISKNKIYINKGVKIICPIRLHGPGKNIQVIGNTLESADKQPGGIHLQDALSWVHKTSYFGDSITIKDNKFIYFKNGIIKNISRKVKDPKLFIQDNEFVGAEKEMEIQNGSVPYKDNQ